MFENLTNKSKITYKNEEYIFIDINEFTYGHWRRGLVCNFYRSILNIKLDKIKREGYVDKLVKCLDFAYNQNESSFIKLYNEIMKESIYNGIKSDLKSTYFYYFIYLNDKDMPKNKRMRKD